MSAERKPPPGLILVAGCYDLHSRVIADASKLFAEPKPPDVLELDGAHYDLQSGTADDVRKGIENGTFSGWHTAAELDAILEANGITVGPDGRTDFGGLFKRLKAEGKIAMRPRKPKKGDEP